MDHGLLLVKYNAGCIYHRTCHMPGCLEVVKGPENRQHRNRLRAPTRPCMQLHMPYGPRLYANYACGNMVKTWPEVFRLSRCMHLFGRCMNIEYSACMTTGQTPLASFCRPGALIISKRFDVQKKHDWYQWSTNTELGSLEGSTYIIQAGLVSDAMTGTVSLICHLVSFLVYGPDSRFTSGLACLEFFTSSSFLNHPLACLASSCRASAIRTPSALTL